VLSIAMTILLLAVPGAVDKMPSSEVAPIFELVCGKGNVFTKHDKSFATNPLQTDFGCKKCPSFTGFADSDGRAAVSEPLPGAFTGPGRTEALVYLFSCEPHANSYGGTVLLRKEQGKWRRISYAPGLGSSSCLTFRRDDGTDLLVSQGGDVAQGYVFGSVTAHRFTQKGTVDVVGNRLASSWYTLNACPEDGTAVAMDIRRVQARDMNNDKKKDVVIDLSAAFARVKKKGDDPCLNEEERKKYLKPKNYQLVYLFDGNSLTASPETRKVLKEMNAERSDILGEPIDEQAARGFIEYWLKRSQDNTKLDEVMNSYSDAVDFYKFGLVEKNIIRQDKQKYYSRWPKRKYELKSFALAPGDRQHEAKVVITFAYEISNEKKTLQGEAKAVLVLQSNDEETRIVTEKEQ